MRGCLWRQEGAQLGGTFVGRTQGLRGTREEWPCKAWSWGRVPPRDGEAGPFGCSACPAGVKVKLSLWVEKPGVACRSSSWPSGGLFPPEN